MWIVAKVKRSEFGLFQNEIKKKISNRVIFYFPKIKQNIQKKGSVKESYIKILEDYIFCYSKTFERKNFFNSIQFIKGLKYFLTGNQNDQKQILNFIDYCKSYEDDKGNIKPEFFKNLVKFKAKFLNGPFKDLIFEIIENKKNNLKISIGNFVTNLSNNKYFYKPI